MAKPCDEPLRVTTEDGFVLLEGGCGVAVTLTPIAAADTGGDLIDNAVQLIGDDRLRHVEVPRPS